MPARHDNFDLLRLLAALMVLWSHQFALLAQLEPSFPLFNSGLGLAIFFAISGYLNTKSLLRNPSWWRFLVRRATRIFPGLFGAAVFCVVLGAVLTTADGSTYWAAVPRFIFKNTGILFGIDYNLPGVFETNPFPRAVNGSLWTLPIEVKFYIYLAIVAVVVRYKPALFLGAVLIVLASVLVWFLVTSRDVATAFSQHFAVVFVTGAGLALLERARGTVFAVVALGGVALIVWPFGGPAPGLMATALAVILLGKLPAISWTRPPLDISYGVYLFAFPIQQFVASLTLPFWPSLGLSLAGTLVFAILSALLIERPALALGRRDWSRTKVVEQTA